MRNVVVGLVILMLLFGAYEVVTNMGVLRSDPYCIDGHVGAVDASIASSRLLTLNGPWTFHPGTFIDPAEPPEGGRIITVPGPWEAGLTHGSYHLRLFGVTPGNYAFLFDTVYTAYEVYVDGSKIIEVGKISGRPEGSIARFIDMVGQFEVESTRPIDVVVLVSNHYHPMGGIGIAPVLGRSASVMRLFGLMVGTSAGLVVLFLVCALIMLFFHGSMNPDKNIILFALFCIALALKVAASNSLFTLLIPVFPISIVSKVEYVTIPIAALAFMHYAIGTYGMRIVIWVRHIFQSLSMVYILLIIAAPISFYYPLLTPYTVVMAMMLAYLLVLMIIDRFKAHKIPVLVSISAFVMLLSVAMQILYFEHWVTSLYLNQIAAFGMSFFVLANFHVFSLRFLHAKQDALAAADLLEEKVRERTLQLNELNSLLSWNASHDELTKLLNRNELIRTYMGRPYATPFSAAYLDLDNFKMINDRFSHSAGDIVLRLLGEHLRTNARSTDILFRVGGDEFVILLPGTGQEGCEAFAARLFKDLEEFCSEIAQRMEQELAIGIELIDECQVTVSMGLAFQEQGRVDLDALVERADELLMGAKSKGKARYMIGPFNTDT